MKKRYRVVTAKPRQLVAAYGKGDDSSHDIQYAWGGSGASKPDARCLSTAIEEAIIHDGRCLREVLEERGYDITTLKFSIDLLPASEPHP
jgi:hypothetical protein